MVSLYDQLISELSLANPRLSQEQISGQITALIQNEILPEAIARIRLPKLPSPVSVKREELRGIRYGKIYPRPLQENVRFIQDLEKLRLRFNGSDLTNEDFPFRFTENTQTLLGPEMEHDAEPDGETQPVEPDIVRERLRFSPYSERLERLQKPSHLINFDSDMKEKIACDSLFEILVGKIESAIRRNYESLRIYFDFSMRRDMDDPGREKTIIHITLPDRDFDEKMEFWDKIEADIRHVIEKLDITESERKTINRNLFTHVEPS